VHNEVRHDLLEADAKQIERTLTRDLVYSILALNSGAITSLRRCPRFEFITQEADDIKLYADSIPKLVDVGMRIPVKHMHDRLQIPIADDGEEILKSTAPMAKASKGVGVKSTDANAILKAHSTFAPKGQTHSDPAHLDKPSCPHCNVVALKGEEASQSDVIDEMAKQLDAETQAPMSKLIDEIKAVVDASESFEELQNNLLNAYGDMDVEELSKIMQQGFSTAELVGRFEVENDNT